MTPLYLLTAIICAAYVLLILSYLHGWKKTSVWLLKLPTPNPRLCTKVSIIIPVRNEEQNILNCLSAIYKQTYPLEYFEVLVVNDHSTDSTVELAGTRKYENLQIIHLAEDRMGKKAAITEAIKNSSGSLIITTDADCEMGTNWLSAIVSFYEEKKSKMIVAPVLLRPELGARSLEKGHEPGGFIQTPNSMLRTFSEIMQSQEMTVLTACACGSLFYNKPVLCSGANLAYEKSAFLALNGFEGVDKNPSGDDMFLMLKIHKKFPGEISYLKSKDAIVFTHPEAIASQALRQRKRWASKTFLYSRGDHRQKRDGLAHVTWVAMLVFFTNFLILLSGIISVINIKFVLVPIAGFSAKFLVDFMLLYSASSFFNRKAHPFIFAIASVIYPFYVSFMGLVSPFTGYSWKSRTS